MGKRARGGPAIQLVMDKEEREYVHEEVSKLAEDLSLPQALRKPAEELGNDVMTRDIANRRRPSVAVAASLYAECRETKTPITLREIAAASGSSALEVARCYRTIVRDLGLEVPNLNGTKFVYRVAVKVGVSEAVLELAKGIISDATRGGFGGRNPMTLASAAIYIAACNMGEKVTQTQVADAAGVSELSLRHCCKDLRNLPCVRRLITV